MRVLFLGTADFAVPALHALVRGDAHRVLAVVTQPDRAQGRGQKPSSSPVKRAALGLGLPVLQPRRVRSAAFLAQTRELAPDVLVLAAFGQVIPQALLDLPPVGPVNIHGSLLPAYRGAAPIQHAILNGERVTGVTTMWMDASLDTGDILLAREVPIGPEETAGDLTERMADVGAELALETLRRLAAGTCPRIPQEHALATWAPAIEPEDCLLTWREPAARAANRVRAAAPRPGAFTTVGGRRLKVWRALALDGGAGAAEPGVLTALSSEGVDVAATPGVVRLLEVQPEGGRRMAAADWARGARVRPGDPLGVQPETGSTK